MSYSHPKVTIDIAEYNDLKAKEKMLQERDLDGEKILYKKCIMALLASCGGMNNRMVTEELIRCGVGIQIVNDGRPYSAGDEYKVLHVYEYKTLAKDAQ